MSVIEALKAFLFGIVEGITEWLPVSSTGHMMLLDQFVQLDVSDSFYDTFLVVIQLGAIMAVIILYFHRLNPFSSRKTTAERKTTWNIWGKVVIGSIPAAIVGLLLDRWMETYVMNDRSVSYLVVSGALIFYGIIFIIIELVNRKRIAATNKALQGRHVALEDGVGRSGTVGENVFTGWQEFGKSSPSGEISTLSAPDEPADPSNVIASVRNFDEMSYGRAFLIGIFQSLAIVPGTSRSGSIIIGSMLVGTSRTVATEFAFFLAIPIMFGWSLLKLIRHGFDYTANEWMIFGVGVVTAFVISILAIKFLIGYVKKNDFTAFGIYRIAIGLVVLSYFGLVA